MKNFIYNHIAQDISTGKNDGKVHTRFPPEPNGYLHIGHAKSICLNFSVTEKYQNGLCNLRFDDSNPEKEGKHYVEAIKEDIRWLGFDWQNRLFFASDYYPQLYDYAVLLIKAGKAYVDSLSAEEIRKYRGTLTAPGKDSPDRNRSIEENLALFEKMRDGEFADGQYILRAKIDMSHANINMRDPAIYRIKKAHHYSTGNAWCIYPLYDFVHGISDALEGVTHSLCTLEFADHRLLYDWFLQQLPVPCRPQQIEFARLNLSYTITSKRKLSELVNSNKVSGWDDPRMPTIAGMRRRGYTAEAIRNFCECIGVTKNDTVINLSVLENCLREDLDKTTIRMLGVLNPLRVVIQNYPEKHSEMLDAPYHPKNTDMGSRQLPFAKIIYIEQDDFMEDPPKKFFRLSLGKEVRLRYAYYITCDEVIKDEKGNIIELHCSYDPLSKGGKTPDARKVKGTIHWVSATHALTAEVRLYDRLFNDATPDSSQNVQDWQTNLNPNSIKILSNAKLEPSLAKVKAGERFQLERLGYFNIDSKDSQTTQPVLNRIITLRDSWAKQK